MSWTTGSHDTDTVELSFPAWRKAQARLCSRLAWVTITPRGAAVEPEVYCRKARVRPAAPGSRQARAADASRASVATQAAAPSRSRRPPEGLERAGAAPAATARAQRSMVLVGPSTTSGRASSTTATARARLRSGDRHRGGKTGTAATRAYRHPKNAATKSSPGGYISSALAPGRARSRRTAATVRLRRSSSA